MTGPAGDPVLEALQRQVDCKVVLFALSDGALASAVALLRLGFRILGIVSFEKDKTLRLLQRLRWPGVIFWDYTEAPLIDFVQALAGPFKSHVDLVFVAGDVGRLHASYFGKKEPLAFVTDI